MGLKSRFLHPSSFSAGETITLSRDESHHLAKVLRIQEGDTVEIFNGKGLVGEGRVANAKATRSEVVVESIHQDENPPRVRVCFAISKPAAAEFILKRCTEVGVAGFQLLETKHSLAAKNWNRDRWERILFEAAKQSQENFLPTLSDPISLQKYLESRDSSRMLVLCDEGHREATPEISQGKTIDVLIGAEGGWAPQEIALLEESGARYLGLGKNRLRTETAALAALVKLNSGI